RTFSCADTATTDPYPLSLHDALPIFSARVLTVAAQSLTGTARHTQQRHRRRLLALAGCRLTLPRDFVAFLFQTRRVDQADGAAKDRKSTRLNSSHVKISYAVFCLKKK